MTPGEPRHSLDEVIAALAIGDAKGRRNFEVYLEWRALERDRITDAELQHLKRATVWGRKRNRSLTEALERTKPISPPALGDAEPPHREGAPEQKEAKRQERDPNPPKGLANLGALAREIHALREEGESIRREHEQVALKLKTEFAYQAAWERRLEHAEDQVRLLWDLVGELERLAGLTAPRLEKVERRVGYQFLRRTERRPSTRTPVGD